MLYNSFTIHYFKIDGANCLQDMPMERELVELSLATHQPSPVETVSLLSHVLHKRIQQQQEKLVCCASGEMHGTCGDL